MRRAAIIGLMIMFALVDTGCRQSSRGRTNAEETKLTLRARPGSLAENTIAISTASSNAPYITHRGDKRGHQGTELNGKYDHEVNRSIPHDDTQKGRYPPGSRRQVPPGSNEEYQKGTGICCVEREKFQSSKCTRWMARAHRKRVLQRCTRSLRVSTACERIF